MPVYISLTRFLETNGFLAMFDLYPFWYLGTTPFRYLIGPLLPSLLILVHRLLPGFNLFEILLALVGLIFPWGAIGVYLLVRELKGSLVSASLAAIFYFFGPIILFLFPFSDGLFLIAFSFLPFILILYLRFLEKWQRKRAVYLCLALAGLFLFSTNIIPTLIFGMAAIFLAQTGWKRAEEKVRQTLVVLVLALIVATIWYTPGYWLTLLTAPSLAGRSLFFVALDLPKLLAVALAFFLAIVSSRFFKKKRLLRDFIFFWLFIFGFLTLSRFIADPDFWLDWSAYGAELQLGIAMGLGYLIGRIKSQSWQSYAIAFSLLLSIGSGLFFFRYKVMGSLQKEIIAAVEYRIGKQLSELIKPGEKAFLSGTTAFWLNAFFDVAQVRGGVDQAAVHPTWDHAAWEIREGEGVEKTEKWLKDLGVKYVVVHTQDSEEFYHDFRHSEKFEKGNFEKVYEEKGDTIYRLKN